MNEKSAAFFELILSKFLENTNNATAPRPPKAGLRLNTIFFSNFRISRAPKKIQIRRKKILFRHSALNEQAEAV
ncbi:hypothetical protein COT20_00470 [bacterium (Candidatus Gribaldobacteria) CG08_land_8_20_14_0_20_39_15]|uniref:Uncharacterized protein n=1 Tax=bacterium (Candidatus Gribaldobacteria) CG08_land_8_20_14_0_20_39_15 TaxID=2014273 RepID=A0A2M6XV38_9BACT|nr:MAG: hypothetical protein COT20_00470 [bacterium (Candidatus Gribaldobacteria) CG08_land_8_20_14_0_20_39_15]